jgi:hypothetical protein
VHFIHEKISGKTDGPQPVTQKGAPTAGRQSVRKALRLNTIAERGKVAARAAADPAEEAAQAADTTAKAAKSALDDALDTERGDDPADDERMPERPWPELSVEERQAP